MQNIVNAYVQKFMQGRAARRRHMALLLALAMLVSLGVSYRLTRTGAAKTDTPVCGQTEHVHTDACYQSVLTCGLTEGEPETQATGESAAAVHTHTAACYTSQLVCTQPEHTHTAACYAQSDEDEEEFTAGSLPFTQPDDYTITLDYTAEAQIPAGASLSVREMDPDSEEYAQQYALVVQALTEAAAQQAATSESAAARAAGLEVEAMRLFDIKILVDGQEFEPAAPVEVRIEYAEAQPMADDASMDVVHLTDGEAKVLDTTAETTEEGVESVAYTTPSFSLFAVVQSRGVTTFANEAALPIDSYIDAVTLSYATVNEDGTKTWTVINGGDTIPADAEIKISGEFSNVPYTDLQSAGGVATITLPNQLKGVTATGSIKDLTIHGSPVVGTITADGGQVVTLTYTDKIWLGELDGNVKGTFEATAKVNLAHVTVSGPTTITIGQVSIDVNFKEDAIAENGDLESEKVLNRVILPTESDPHGYLEYTLTVTVPEGSVAMPDVSVVDHFTSGADYVQNYVGIPTTSTLTGKVTNVKEEITAGTAAPVASSIYNTNAPTEDVKIPDALGDGETLTEPGALVWKIGNMASGESRTLTYRVQLQDKFVGGSQANAIGNQADVYSKKYPHGNPPASFTNKAAANTKKTSGVITLNEDGTATVTYKVTVDAPADNTFTLEDIIVYDYLTGDAIRNGATYSNVTISGYDKVDETDKPITPITVANPTETTETVSIVSNPTTAITYDKVLQAELGDLAPGAHREVTYTLNLSAEAVATNIKNNTNANGAGKLQVNNTAATYSDHDGGKFTQADKTTYLVVNGKLRKVSTNVLHETDTISFGEDDVYSAPGKKDESGETGFTLIDPSYKYQAVINETALLDYSDVEIKDTLQETALASGSKRFLKFYGYVQVQAYDRDAAKDLPTNANGDLTNNDQQTVDYFGGKTPVKTVWVKLGENSDSFSFKPSDIGLDGKYAYRLTYYVTTQNMDDMANAVVTNKLEQSGNVGLGDNTIKINGNVEHTQTVTGGYAFAANKQAWYYITEVPEADQANYPYAQLYWAIKVTGGIKAGTEFQDNSTGKNELKADDALLGVFVGPSDLDFADYADYSALMASGLLAQNNSATKYATKADYDANTAETDYQYAYDKGTDDQYKNNDKFLYIKFNKEVVLDESQAVYILVRTSMMEDFDGSQKQGGATKTLYNKLSVQQPGENKFTEANTASMSMAYKNGLSKLTGSNAYTASYNAQNKLTFSKLDGSHYQPGVTDTSSPDPSTTYTWYGGDEAKVPGIYVSWNVVINRDGQADGVVRVKDQLPEGTELAYVTINGRGSNSPIKGVEITDLDSRYTKVVTTKSNVPCIYYYNAETREVQWAVGDFTRRNNNSETWVTFQVVARVTAPDLMLSDTALTNVATQTVNGLTSSDSATETIKKNSLNKTAVENGSQIDFTLTVNPYGVDLLKNATTIDLVDVIGNNLRFLLDTVKVKDAAGDPITGYTVGFETNAEGKRQMTIKGLPDDQKLTITYSASVNAEPGVTVSLENIAHWVGREDTSTKYENKTYSYTINATSEAENAKVTLTIKKFDSADNTHMLGGAEFEVTEVAFYDTAANNGEGGIVEPSTTPEPTKIVTDDTGIATLKDLNRNTIYKIVEKTAPSGYIKDETPYYFVVEHAIGSTLNSEGGHDYYYPEFGEYAQSKGYTLNIQNEVLEYIYQAPNSKGKITLTKAFSDLNGENTAAIGTYTFGLYKEVDSKLSLVEKKELPISSANSSRIIEFTDLDVDATYYLYECSSDGSPVYEGGTVVVGDGQYVVSYDKESIQLTSKDPNGTITVTNEAKTYDLPKTGGRGTLLYTLGGLTLMAGSLLAALRKKRKIEGAG